MPDLSTSFDSPFMFNLLSFALSLLLVFKTNAGYSRWVEARGAWGTIFIVLRNLIFKTQAFAPPSMTVRQRLKFVRWVMTLPYVMRSHLLSYVPGSLALEHLLTEEESAWLQSQRHLPLAVVQMIGSILKSVEGWDPILVSQVHLELSGFVNNLTICERLASTPVPLAYTRCAVLIISLVCQPSHSQKRCFSTVSLRKVPLWYHFTPKIAALVPFLSQGV